MPKHWHLWILARPIGHAVEREGVRKGQRCADKRYVVAGVGVGERTAMEGPKQHFIGEMKARLQPGVCWFLRFQRFQTILATCLNILFFNALSCTLKLPGL